MATFHLLETKEPNDGVLLAALLFGCIVSFVVRNLCHGTRYPPPAPNSCLKTWLVIKECTSRSHGNRYFDILWIENLSGYSCRVTVLQQESVISYFALHAEQFHNRGGCIPTANETRLLLWHCEASDKKHFSSRIGHVYQIWFPVEKWKCHMKVPSRKLWFRKVTSRPFF